MSDQKLLDKIAALYRKAESTPFAEERAALLDKVNELIEKYQVDLYEALAQGRQTSRPVSHRLVGFGGPEGELPLFRLVILQACAKLCFCRVLFVTASPSLQAQRGARTAFVIGRDVDIDTTMFLFSKVVLELYQRVSVDSADAIRIGVIHSPENPDGVSMKHWLETYLPAAAHQVDRRVDQILLERRSANNATRAIVLSNESELENYMRQQFRSWDDSGLKRTVWSKDAERHGQAAGDAVSLVDKELRP